MKSYCRNCDIISDEGDLYCSCCRSLTERGPHVERMGSGQRMWDPNSKVYVVRYKNQGGDPDSGYRCRFTFQMTDLVKWETLRLLKNNTDSHVILVNDAKSELISDEPNELSVLYINGLGRDNRCAWCAYFKRLLTSHIERDGYTLKQIGNCPPKIRN